METTRQIAAHIIRSAHCATVELLIDTLKDIYEVENLDADTKAMALFALTRAGVSREGE